jgi:hypothetical protein
MFHTVHSLAFVLAGFYNFMLYDFFIGAGCSIRHAPASVHEPRAAAAAHGHERAEQQGSGTNGATPIPCSHTI